MLAALTVLLFHASALALDRLQYGRFMQVFDGRFGIFGVSLFFSISGYLMATAIRVQSPFAFLSHRVVRIYPLLCVVYAVHYAVFRLAHSPYPVDIRSFLLVPYEQASGPLGVEWSLIFEIVFYVSIFAIGALRLTAWLPAIAIGWLGLLAVHTCLSLDGESPHLTIQRILTHPACVPLAAGLLIPSLLARRPPPILPIGLGFILCGLYSFGPQNLDVARWLFGCGTALILAGAISLSAERPSFGDTPLGRFLAKTADYSYALYLCHMPIVLAVYTIGKGASSAGLWVIAVIGSLCVATLAGMLDVILYQRLKLIVSRAGPRVVAVSMLAYIAVYLTVSLQANYAAYVAGARDKETLALARRLTAQEHAAPGQSPALILKGAGFAAADTVLGNVETMHQADGGLLLGGWALDVGKSRLSPAVVFFQNGRVIGSASTVLARPDVRRAYRHSARDAGFLTRVETPCITGAIEAAAVTPDKRYAILPNRQPPLTCP